MTVRFFFSRQTPVVLTSISQAAQRSFQNGHKDYDPQDTGAPKKMVSYPLFIEGNHWHFENAVGSNIIAAKNDFAAKTFMPLNSIATLRLLCIYGSSVFGGRAVFVRVAKRNISMTIVRYILCAFNMIKTALLEFPPFAA